MSDQHEMAEKTRISVTMTGPYVEALDRLVEEDLYVKQGDAVLEGLRIIFRRRRLDPFRLYEEAAEKDAGKMS